MNLKAYVLAADPAWIEASVLSYYDFVKEIVVSYDENGQGWTGAPISVDECLRRLRALDRDRKMRYCPGTYARPGYTPMENDTYQRQCTLNQVGTEADWILQLDTDEILPRPQALLSMLETADLIDIPAVQWPMRVLFRKLAKGGFLQVCASDGSDNFEYPGPIAVKPGAELYDARYSRGRYVRPIVVGDTKSLQVCLPPTPDETRITLDDADAAILHNSWGRSSASIRSKIASWSHNQGLKSWMFYYMRWKPAPHLWRVTRNFHPLTHGLWPALKPLKEFPASIPAELLQRTV